jgi:hypothetical protein
MRFSLVIAVLAPVAVSAQNPTRTSTVSGTVFDSIGRAPLAGASVQLLGTSGSANGRMLSTTADTLGRFRIDSVPFGDYVAGFFHYAIDSLGIDVKSRAVRVNAAQTRVNLASPSPAEMITAFCGAASLRDSTALLIGHVRNAESESPIVGADVLLEWTETSIERGRGLITRDRVATARTIAGGWFALCGVPAGSPMMSRAAFQRDTSGYVTHESRLRSVAHVSFTIGRTQRIALVDSAADTVRVDRGSARLIGRVLTQQGQPVSARVDVPNTGLSAQTTSDGRFTIDSLPSGTRTVTVRAIGFSPTDHVVHLAEGRPTTSELRFPETAVVLAAVAVRAEQVFSRKLHTFETNRRRSVGGSFYRPGPENALEHATLVTLVQQTPRYSIRYGRGEYSAVLRLPPPRLECVPSLWVDGARFRMDFEQLVAAIGPGEILAAEIYSSPQTMPAQYMENGCGAIAVWTKDPPPKKQGTTPPLRH